MKPSLGAILSGLVGKTTGSLFSSGGGWEVGAVRAGLQPLWGVEYDAVRARIWNQTFKVPLGEPGCMVGDVWDKQILARTTPVDILFTSPVCRDFSKARSKYDVAKADPCRPKLGLATIQYVQKLRPKAILLENVEEYADSPIYVQLKTELQALGYSVTEGVLNAADFGNPSMRRRLFAVFLRLDLGKTYRFPTGLPMSRISWDKALAPYISQLPRETPTDDPIKRLAEWESVETPVYPFMYVTQKMSQITINGKKEPFRFVRAGRPAPTLGVGHDAMKGWRIYLAPNDIRGLGSIGALVLNGFIVKGKFPAAYGTGFDPKVIRDICGDAVSPIMAEALLNNLKL